MPKPRADSRKVNQLNTAAKLRIKKIAVLLLEAEHAAVRGNLDAIQDCHLKISKLLLEADDALKEIQDICKANGDTDENSP